MLGERRNVVYLDDRCARAESKQNTKTGFRVGECLDESVGAVRITGVNSFLARDWDDGVAVAVVDALCVGQK